jgi:IclR family transcriptional regulator, acetate operon repressor
MSLAAGPGSSSAASALRLVMLLAERGSIRVTEAARELGVSAPTAYRLLALLCHMGLAAQQADRSYVPGPGFARLSMGQSFPETLRMVVRSHLRRVADTTGETSHLMVREGQTVRFLISAEGPGALRVASREGVILPAHKTSGGKALLAEMPPAELRALYPGGVIDPGRPGKPDLSALLRELHSVRQQRFALNIDESEPGISAVGIVLRHRHGQAVGALSVSAPSSRFRGDRVVHLVGALREAASDIAFSL